MVLTKRKSGLVPLEYLRITFKDVIVSDIDIDISLGARDLAKIGVSGGTLQQLLRSGQLFRIVRGLYVSP
ncbi:MAG TPA: type IV toxin-antitoxin system AbiEi family antitoxin domain-containing protein [Limnobacter sp.]|nr:type IV toxin-antitoxin system AbiEi family antitoxin domain-containing protein [Limnobacter sp.]